jgi:hypothetical protein
MVNDQALRTAEDELEHLAARLEPVVPDGAYPAAALALGIARGRSF